MNSSGQPKVWFLMMVLAVAALVGCGPKPPPNGEVGVYEPAGDLVSVYREGFDPPAGAKKLPSPDGERIVFAPTPSNIDLENLARRKPAAIGIPYWWFGKVFDEPRLPTLKAVHVTSFDGKSVDLRQVRLNGVFKSVRALQIPFATGVDEKLADLMDHFPELELIELSDSDLGDSGFAQLISNERIQYMDVSRTRITELSLPILRNRSGKVEVKAYGTPLEAVLETPE